MMLAFTRRIPQHVRDQQDRNWRRSSRYGEIQDAVLCIVGLGSIGTEVARRGVALGMRVIGVRKHVSKRHELVDEVYPIEKLKKAVTQADHVVSILPGGAGTDRLFTADVFAHFKQGAYFYNLGRGNAVDEGALVNSLSSGHLAGGYRQPRPFGHV